MTTPSGQIGITTERIMEEVRKRLPNMDTHTYNRVYESVMHVLAIQNTSGPDVVVHSHGGGMMINRRRTQ